MKTIIEGLEKVVSNEIDRVMKEAKGVENFGGADIVFAGGCSKKNCDVKYFIPTIASRDISWLIEELKKGNSDFNDPKYYEIIAKYSMDYVGKYESDFKEGKMTRGAYVSGLLLYILKALKEVV